MLHNKYFEILEHLLGDYNGEVYGRELAKKVTLSQKSVALTLADLEKQGILKSRKSGNMKYYSLNLKNIEIKDFLVLSEVFRKTRFSRQHRKLSEIFKQDGRIVGVFGSYAKGEETKESDIDLFIIGKKADYDYDRKGGLFDLRISIKYFSEAVFKKLSKERNNLIREIVKSHIIIFGFERFIGLVWRHYYGFD